MRLKTLFFSLAVAGVIFAQSSIRVPAAGFLRDAAGTVRPVRGIGGTFLLGEGYVEGAISVAFSGRSGLVKTDGEILVLDQDGAVVKRCVVSPGRALFAFDDSGTPFAAFLLDTGQLLRWVHGEWRMAAANIADLDGQVVSISMVRAGVIALAIHRGEAYWTRHVSAENGQVVFEAVLPDVAEPLLMLNGGAIVFQRNGELVHRAVDGMETTVPISQQTVALELMGEGWIRAVMEEENSGIAIRVLERASLPEAGRSRRKSGTSIRGGILRTADYHAAANLRMYHLPGVKQ